MTLEQFRQNIELKKEMEFSSRGIDFSISYGRDDDGKNYIAFGEKHLLDKFYLEDGMRVSLRGKILREMIGNLLIHREFSSARYARLIIERDRMYTENANRAFRYGRITRRTWSRSRRTRSSRTSSTRFVLPTNSVPASGTSTTTSRYTRMPSPCLTKMTCSGSPFPLTTPIPPTAH